MIALAKKSFLKWKRYGQVYILPTKFGVLLFLLLLLLLIMGLGYQNNLVLLTVFILTSLVIMLMVEAHFYLLHLQPLKLKTADVCVGEKTRLRLEIEPLETDEDISIDLIIQDFKMVIPLQGTKTSLSGTALFNRRGRYQALEICLRSTYPFGFFKVWSYHQVPVTIYVYPRPLKGPVNFIHSSHQDEHLQIDHHGDEEFDQLKTWSPSLGLTKIQWKKLAATDQWYYASYQGLKGSHAWFDLDLISNEEQLSYLTSNVLEAYTQNQKWRISGKNFDSNWGTGKQHLELCLRNLAVHKF